MKRAIKSHTEHPRLTDWIRRAVNAWGIEVRSEMLASQTWMRSRCISMGMIQSTSSTENVARPDIRACTGRTASTACIRPGTARSSTPTSTVPPTSCGKHFRKPPTAGSLPGFNSVEIIRHPDLQKAAAVRKSQLAANASRPETTPE